MTRPSLRDPDGAAPWYRLDRHDRHVTFTLHSVSLYSILFYSILFYSIPFTSTGKIAPEHVKERELALELAQLPDVIGFILADLMPR